MSGELGESVRRAVLWRSGSQIFSQLVAWSSTLAVIRILNPADYGLFAMAEVVLVFLMFLNGYGFAGSLVKEAEVSETKLRQAFGILLLVNCSLALLQVVIAPLAADYYRQPIVADLLRTQALIFLATPFIALPEVMLMRQMNFRTQAIVNIAATVVSAAVALACALAGYGVWTLIYAPIALFWTKAIGLVVTTRVIVRPSFRFAGAGGMFNFGMAMILVQLCWIVMSKADAFLAARTLTAHDLGLYSEAFFLTSLVATKFVPPLNDVAFPAYSRLQHDRALLGASFLKAVRLILLLTCPLYFGLAVVAPDAIAVVLGDKWVAMAGLVTILGFAMPALTLHIIFAPAINATGQVRISMRASIFGAILMPIAFYTGMHWGAEGLAYSWLAAAPLLPLFTFIMARKLLHITVRDFAGAIAPGLFSASAMALAIHQLGEHLGALASWARLLAEISAGAIVYAAILLLTSRETVRELYGLVVRRTPPVPSPA